MPVVLLKGDRLSWTNNQTFQNATWLANNLDRPNAWPRDVPNHIGFIIMHELGHAWGAIKDGRIAAGATWKRAVLWESAAYVAAFGPDVPRRIKHWGM